MLQASWTSTRNTQASTSGNFPHNDAAIVQQVSLFYAGKISDHTGMFSQVTYDGVEKRTTIDNVDLRYANRIALDPGKLQYGFTLHNNPMMQDLYNTGATWGFPYASSPVAVTPNASPVIENLGQQVAGIGAYGMWNDTVYAEVSAYHTANHVFSPLRLGIKRSEAAALAGYNPYWRLALQHEWDNGKSSAMIGTYGLVLRQFPDNNDLAGPTDRFHDIGFDAQYQYLTDTHRITGQVNYVKERQHYNPNSDNNPSDRLNTLRGKLTYYYLKQYGINLGYFSIRGTEDDALYNTGDPVIGSGNGSPDSAGYIVDLNYLPSRDVRLELQYTAYRKFNGMRRNYDGFGRNAADNNSLYLLAWLMF